MWELILKDPEIRNLSLEHNLITFEEYVAKHTEYLTDRKKFLEEIKIAWNPHFENIKMFLKKKRLEQNRKESMARQSGVPFEERRSMKEKYDRLENEFIKKHLHHKMITDLSPDDVDFIRRYGVERFLSIFF